MHSCFPLHKRFLTPIAICFENRLLVNKNVNSPLQLSANSFPNGKSGSESPEIDGPFISPIFFAFSHFILTRRPVSLHTALCYDNVRKRSRPHVPARQRPILDSNDKVARFLYRVQILTSFSMIYRGPLP